MYKRQAEFYDILFDDGKFTELNPDVESVDMLNFKDSKAYVDRLKAVSYTHLDVYKRQFFDSRNVVLATYFVPKP